MIYELSAQKQFTVFFLVVMPVARIDVLSIVYLLIEAYKKNFLEKK